MPAAPPPPVEPWPYPLRPGSLPSPLAWRFWSSRACAPSPGRGRPPQRLGDGGEVSVKPRRCRPRWALGRALKAPYCAGRKASASLPGVGSGSTRPRSSSFPVDAEGRLVSSSAAALAAPGRTMASNGERTFIAVKPDGVQRGLVGEIIKRFEQKGFRLVAMKFMHASENLLKQHYIDLKDRPFYPGLVKYMNSGPVVAMVWEGLNVVKTGRVMLGETNPADSKPGTIRGDFCIQVGRNIIHGSDSVESAQKEIQLWFQPAELVDFKSCAHDWIYE
uniref:Nucleoside diphosphate kinase n=2 Tax=Gopherus evgoodei TaxID=1825980 RepID=A0A8C4WFG7_9SAUR